MWEYFTRGLHHAVDELGAPFFLSAMHLLSFVTLPLFLPAVLLSTMATLLLPLASSLPLTYLRQFPLIGLHVDSIVILLGKLSDQKWSSDATTIFRNLSTSSPAGESFRDRRTRSWDKFLTDNISATIRPLHPTGSAINPDPSSSSSSVERALCQSLCLMTDLPSTSPKYGFIRSVAEELLRANDSSKDLNLSEANRRALLQAFSRTISRLESSLKRGQATGFGLTQILDQVSRGAAAAAAVVVAASGGGGGVSGSSGNGEIRRMTGGNGGENLHAEKLSQELLWLVLKLQGRKGIEQVVEVWAEARVLSELAVRSSPRVQLNLLKLTCIVLDLVSSHVVSCDVKSQEHLLLHWMPLLCQYPNTCDGLLSSDSNRQRTEEDMCTMITRLPAASQELVYVAWLHEYTWSTSDWPNLHPAFLLWCDTSRTNADQVTTNHGEASQALQQSLVSM
ncbi:unnamed protein product [Closterium sp. NIES-54]